MELTKPKSKGSARPKEKIIVNYSEWQMEVSPKKIKVTQFVNRIQ